MKREAPDVLDLKILALLREDGRMSLSAIGEAVGLSRTAVKSRMEALEREGVILGYKAVIAPEKADGEMLFVVNIETEAAHFEEAKDCLRTSKRTVLLLQTTGNCHLLALCRAKDLSEMKRFLTELYRQAEGIALVNAHAVLEEVKGQI